MSGLDVEVGSNWDASHPDLTRREARKPEKIARSLERNRESVREDWTLAPVAARSERTQEYDSVKSTAD